MIISGRPPSLCAHLCCLTQKHVNIRRHFHSHVHWVTRNAAEREVILPETDDLKTDYQHEYKVTLNHFLIFYVKAH